MPQFKIGSALLEGVAGRNGSSGLSKIVNDSLTELKQFSKEFQDWFTRSGTGIPELKGKGYYRYHAHFRRTEKVGKGEPGDLCAIYQFSGDVFGRL